MCAAKIVGEIGPHATAQNRRDCIGEQPSYIRAEFFALPDRGLRTLRRPFASAIGYCLFAASLSELALFTEQLLQLLHLTAEDELFERLMIGAFGEIDFEDLLE